MVRYCPDCGGEIVENDRFCKSCGEELLPQKTDKIAEKLDKPKGTILSKIYRMRKKLIEQFDDSSNDVMETGR